MKLLSIVFSIFLFSSFAERSNLSGTYCQSDGYQSTCISFLPNNRFNLSSISSTENTFGLGSYRIDRKTLVLNFDKLDTLPGKSNIKIRYIDIPDTSKLITVELKAVDLNNNPISLLGVKITPLNSEESYFINCNLDGYESVALHKSDNEAILSCVSSFYEEYESTISLIQSSQILLQLDEKRTPIQDTTISFKYKRITDSSIVISPKFIYSKQH